MTTGRAWAARLAALAVAFIIPACQPNSGNLGTSQSLWVGNAGQAGPAPAQVFWVDPNLGSTNLYVADPYDVRTYTRPDIIILGLNHPLMTDVNAKNFPNIVFNETRAMDLINQQRKKVFIDILGAPLPYTLTPVLTDHTGLRQNARAHCRHYATWHAATPAGVPIPFPPGGAANAEGDTWTDRLMLCGLTVAGGAELTLAGLNYRSGDDVGAYWIQNYCQGPAVKGGPLPGGQVLLDIGATHMSIGFWQLGGQGLVYYWCLIIAQDPNTAVTLPTIPFGGPGF